MGGFRSKTIICATVHIHGRAARGAARPCAGARAARACERQLLSSSEGRSTPRSKAAPWSAYVCRVHDSGAAPPSLSDRDGAWRQPDRQPTSPARPTAARAGRSISCAAATRSMWSDQVARGPRRVLVAAGVRARCSPRASPSPSSASSRRSVIGNGRRRICTRSGRAPASRGDPAFDQFLRLTVSLDRELPEAAGDQPRTRWGAASTRSVRRSCSLIRNRIVQLAVADVRPNLIKAMVAVEPSGPPVHDIENTARRLVQDAERTKVSGWPTSRLPTIRRCPPARTRVRAPGQAGQARPGALLAAEGARAPVAELKRIPVVIIVSRGVLSQDAPTTTATSNYLTQAGVPNTLIPLPMSACSQRPHDDDREETTPRSPT